jgi:hypothetical protein
MAPGAFPGAGEGRRAILAGERGPGKGARVAYALRPAPIGQQVRWNDA